MTAITALIVAAAGTYALRRGSTLAFQGRSLPASVADGLRLAALGVLGSLVVEGLPSHPSLSVTGLPSLLGLTGAVLAGRRTANLTLVMLTGVGAYAVTGAVAHVLVP